MKRSIRAFSLVFLAIMLLSLLPMAISADTAEGWVLDSDGIERYYTDGAFVTGICKIGEFTYKFADDGSCLGVYDGHTDIGTAGVPNTAEYKQALAALGSNKILGYYTMDPGETYKSTSYTTDNYWQL